MNWETNPPRFVCTMHNHKTNLRKGVIVWNVPAGVKTWSIDVPINDNGSSDRVHINYDWPTHMCNPEELYSEEIDNKEMTEDD